MYEDDVKPVDRTGTNNYVYDIGFDASTIEDPPMLLVTDAQMGTSAGCNAFTGGTFCVLLF